MPRSRRGCAGPRGRRDSPPQRRRRRVGSRGQSSQLGRSSNYCVALPDSRSLRGRLAGVVAAEYFVTQLGVFSLLPVLPVILKTRVTGSPGAAGAILFAFLVTYRGASIAVGGALERVSSKRALLDWRSYVGLFRERSLRFLIVTSAAVWFFYAQLFSGLPVHLFAHFGSRGLIASFFALNAVLIILLQYPLAAGLSRRPSGMRSESYMEVLALGFVLFGVSFVVLGAAGAALAGVYAAVVLFTLAEMLSTPLLDAAFAHLGHAGRHVLSFNARKLAQVVGEGVGGFSGIALQNFFVHHGGESSYWWLLGACSLATSAVVHAVNVTQVTATASEL